MFDSDLGDLVELGQRELLPDCLQTALLNALQQNAHVLSTRPQGTLSVARMDEQILHIITRILALIAFIEDLLREVNSASC